MTKIKWLSVSLIGALLLSTLYLVGFRTHSDVRIGYIDLPKAFERFEMKKDFQERLGKELVQKNKILDSLKLALGNLPVGTAKEQGFVAMKRQELIQTSESFQLEHQQAIKNYDSQILNRLNQYVNLYAQKHDYDFILGAEGSGVVMAANEDLDLTEEVIEFVNAKYAGE